MIKTIQTKIHKPSQFKKSILNALFSNYTNAYNEMMEYGKEKIEYIKENLCNDKGEFKGETVAKVFSGTSFHNKYNLEPLGDCLKKDVGCSIASYLELSKVQENANYPIDNDEDIIEETINNYIEELRDNIYLNPEDIHNIKTELDSLYSQLEHSNNVRPISFARYEYGRDASILYCPSKNTYYAKLYIFNKETKKTYEESYKRNTNNIKRDLDLYYIGRKDKDGNIISEPYIESKSLSYIILPLAFGRWHEKFLKDARINKNNFKKICAMKLIKRGDEFYLDVPIEYEDNPKFKSEELENKLGIDLGVSNIATISVLDNDNKIIISKEYDGKEYLDLFERYAIKLADTQIKGSSKYPRDKKYIQGSLHRVANDIVKIAKENKAMIYMEDLNIDKSYEKLRSNKKFDNYAKSGIKKIVKNINRWAYGQMYDILCQKCTVEGLPKPKKVNAKYTSEECSVCGHNSVIATRGKIRNRENQSEFICKKCGHTMNADINASINIAQRYSKAINLTVKEVDSRFILKNKLFKFEGVGESKEECLKDFIIKLREYKVEYDKIENKNANQKKQYAILKNVNEENYDRYYIVE